MGGCLKQWVTTISLTGVSSSASCLSLSLLSNANVHRFLKGVLCTLSFRVTWPEYLTTKRWVWNLMQVINRQTGLITYSLKYFVCKAARSVKALARGPWQSQLVKGLTMDLLKNTNSVFLLHDKL